MKNYALIVSSRPWAFALCAAATLLVTPLAGAQSSGRMGDAQSVFQSERNACLSGQSHQDRATCLKEATNAYKEARNGKLGNGMGDSQLEHNRLARCNVQAPQDRQACERNARGEGVTSGSVHGGGIIREITTTVTN